MDLPYVKSEIKDGIATIEFFHPNHNALPGNLLRKLEQTLMQASENEEVALILLQSGGNRTFCAGANFQELLSIRNEKEGKEFFLGFARVINAMRKNKKIIVGRIQGKAVGGGVGLAAACDITLATKYAAVRLSEINIGIGPFVIAAAVERKIGLTPFMNMTLNPNEWLSADKLYQLGMYSQIFEDTESMDAHLCEYLDDMKQKSPEALAALKNLFWEGTEDWDQRMEERAEISGRLILSDYSKNALNKD